MQYVNIHGQPVSTASPVGYGKPKADAPKSFHKGWKVLGVAPGRLKEAIQQHADHQKRIPERDRKPFNQSEWLRVATLKPVQSKPLATPEGAAQLAEMARAAGWLNVIQQEVKKGGK
ncbi:hypothetical protein HNP33_003075 [Comamonas odontotermitis]|uniref:Uncharacterized protein n=1 Tax=Comamonas odontotermitis TaxID=379895 RepID=A0ABR6RII0_9BURK|nr:hypothetical protein [Comamonas odontotermitis]MBB6578970.1 hypothetical protein [Comamonas odontotermitis]